MLKTVSNALDVVMEHTISSSRESIENYVEKLRSQNPGISNDGLAKKIVRRKSLKSGAIGAVTALGGMVTLPVSIPANLIGSWKVQIAMAMAVANAYGHTPQTSDFKTDIYLIMAGNSAKEALKEFGIKASQEVTKRAVQKYITKDLMKKICKLIGNKIISKAGEKTLTSFMKMVPFIGAPVGFAFDWVSARAAGYTAIKYYRN